MAESTKLVRIKPTSPREVQVILGRTFRKDKGWYQIPVSLAATLAEVRQNDGEDGFDDGVRLFEVKDRVDAAAVVAAELVRVDPAGTVDNPATFIEDPMPEEPEELEEEPVPAPVKAPAGRRLRKGSLPPAPEETFAPTEASTASDIPGAPRRSRK